MDEAGDAGCAGPVLGSPGLLLVRESTPTPIDLVAYNASARGAWGRAGVMPIISDGVIAIQESYDVSANVFGGRHRAVRMSSR
jgi:hypothetical protein